MVNEAAPLQRRVLVCPDSFKGTYSAREVAHHIATGLAQVAGIAADELPLGDGGEGTAAALAEPGAERVAVTVAGPLGEPVPAQVTRVEGDTWIVEASAACGLHLLPRNGSRPFLTSTEGVGDLILAAARVGARHVLVAAGGTSTTDGGAGAARVLRTARTLPRITVLCDTETAFAAAATVFGPQKGATRAGVRLLAGRLDQLGAQLPRDPRGVRFTGAAGGLAGGLWSEFDAELVSGATYVLDRVCFAQRAHGAALVVTGEGQADNQSLNGKLVGTISRSAREAGIPLALVVGRSRLSPLHRRRLGTRMVLEASDAAELVAAGRVIGRALVTPHPNPARTQQTTTEER